MSNVLKKEWFEQWGEFDSHELSSMSEMEPWFSLTMKDLVYLGNHFIIGIGGTNQIAMNDLFEKLREYTWQRCKDIECQTF